jgi:hypothetical protein
MLFIIRSRLLCFLSALTLAASVSSGSVVPTREFGPCLNSGKPSGMSSRDQHATDWLAHHGVGNFPTAEDDGGVNAVVRHWLRSRFLIDYMSFRLREYIEPKNQNHATSRPLYPGSSGRSLPLKIIDGSGSTAASVAMIRKASRDLYHGLNLHGLAEYRKRHAVDAISTSDSDGRPVSGTMKFSLGLAMKWAGSKARLLIAPSARSLLSPDGVTLNELPIQPVGKIQFVLSVLVQSIDPSDDLRATCIGCMARATGTGSVDWGMFNESRIGDSLIQMSFFVNVPEQLATADFPRKLASYIANHRGTGLTQCVRAQSRAFLAGIIDTGLLPAQRQNAAFVSNNAKLAPWIVGAIVGGVAGVALIVAFVLIRTTTKKTYPPEEYTKNPPKETAPEPTDDQEIEIMA